MKRARVSRLRVLAKHAGICAMVYAGLTAIHTFPLCLQFTEAVPVGEGYQDSCVFMWNLWWVKEAIFEAGGALFRTPLVGIGDGVNLFYHTLCPLNGILSAPIQWLVPGPRGLILSHNALIFLSFVATGLAVYALALHYTHSFRGAMVAGALAAFSSHRLIHTEHPNLLSTHWLALAILFLSRTLRRGRPVDGAAFGLFALCVLWSSFTYAFFLALLCPIWISWALLRSRRRSGACWLALSVGGGVVLIGTLPLVGPGLEALELTWRQPSMDVATRGGANVAALFAPWEQKSLLARGLHSPPTAYRGADLPDARLGFALLVLAMVGAVKSWRQAWGVAVGAIVFLILALGPHLHVYMHTVQNLPMPYELLWEWVPIFRISRAPPRFLVVTRILLAVLAAYGVRSLGVPTRSRARRTWVRSAAVVVILALLTAESCIAPIPLFACRIPDFYARLSQIQGDFAILEVPIDIAPFGNRYLLYQTVHGKRLLHANLARHAAQFDYACLWKRLANLTRPLRPSDRALLSRYQIRFVIWHMDTSGGPDDPIEWEQVY